MMTTIIDKLLQSDEPAVRFKVLVHVVGRDKNSAEIRQLQQDIQTSCCVPVNE